jgi:hypothetical protein
MINKIYKRIHNKYSILFKFLFFLRYLFVIFFISVVMFFTIPHFFDYKKKDAVIKEFLLDNYNLKLQEYENIKYNALPIPNIEIKNIKAGVETDTIKIDALSLKIYPKLLNIYNYVDFKTNKIVLNKSRILLSDNNLKALIAYIYNSKNKLIIINSNLQVKKSDSLLINIKNLHFSNHRYNKNIFTGELFKKKFKIIISDNFNKINFKLFKTGVTAEVNLNEIKNEYLKNGVFKSKFLNSNLKFNFEYDDKKIKIYNSFFRNKDLSFNNETIVIYKPFFSFNSIFKIEDIDINLFKDLNLNLILAQKEFIKNINTRNKIDFKSKKFDKNLIDNLNLKINLAYGRLTYTKIIEISDSLFKCQGNINLLIEYPILYFDCKITSKDKKKFLKGFSIKNKNKNEIFNIKVEGNVNILNNKINFKNITANQDYEASKEDLNYFKTSFERIFFNKNLLGIFDIKKIREFIIEIS